MVLSALQGSLRCPYFQIQLQWHKLNSTGVVAGGEGD